ncbi:beta-taxilin isoform X1 [Channa argus]|uniref:beta-taxilin isoform X1 n=1 Tax=Channa argus TaxID=215402 RepID=UPI003522DB1D
METSMKAANVLVPPEADMVPPPSSSSSSPPDADSTQSGAAAAPCGDSSDFFSPMEEFSRRLEDIVTAHGSASSLLDRQDVMEVELEKMQGQAKEDITVATATEVSLIKQSLNNGSSPEEKLEDVVSKYAQLAVLRSCDEKKLCVLQQRLSVLLEERQQLQAERRSSTVARSKLEALCRDLQGHYKVLREETLQRCREDEEKRKEMNSHFQQMLTEIQAQIEQHSARNDKLCHENTNLTDKLESLMKQCELREQSLEKINRHHDLEHKLTEAKLEQANALLAEAEEKHKREKEYLLLQAAEWKLQAQTLREQGTVMQAQLTLYGQKFDEFQETLAKSNEIYVRFKKEMENMSDKMKKLEKESSLWKTRFENCNKALIDMIEERTEKSKEYDLFVLKIQRLEKLCHALQDERKVLYNKIKEVRCANSNLPAKVFGSSKLSDDSDDKSALLTPLELQELQETDPALTEDMARLREEQAKLQEFAVSLLTPVSDNENDNNNDVDLEEDPVSAAFNQFKTKSQVKKEAISVAEEQVVGVKLEAAEPDFSKPDKAEEVQSPDQSKPQKSSDTTTTDPQPEVQTPIEDKEVQHVQTNEEIQQQQNPTEQVKTSEVKDIQIHPLSDLKLQEVVAVGEQVVQTQVEDKEVQQVQINEEIQQQQNPAEPAQTPEVEEVQINSLTDPKSDKAVGQTKDKEGQQVQTNEEIQQQQKPPEQVPTPETKEVQDLRPSDPKTEAAEAKILEETGEVKPVEPVEEDKTQQQLSESLQVSDKAPTKSEPAAPCENLQNTAASSTKQPPKKKKKKSGKNAN